MIVKRLEDQKAGSEAVTRLRSIAICSSQTAIALILWRRRHWGSGRAWRSKRGSGATHGHHVKRTLEGRNSRVGIVFRNPGRTDRKSFSSETWRRWCCGEIVECSSILHEIHEIALMERRCGEEIRSTENFLLVGCISSVFYQRSCDECCLLKERGGGAAYGSSVWIEKGAICIVKKRIHETSQV